MTTAAPEEVTLSDNWLDQDVPCQSLKPRANGAGQIIHDVNCPHPAVKRVLITCKSNWQRWRFHCDQCLIDLRNGRMGCKCCGTACREISG